MIQAQADKEAVVIAPAAGDTSVTSTAWIDTLGYDYCKVLVTMATHATNDKLFDAFAITESDTSAASATSAIVALTGTTNTVTSTSAGFVIPAGVSTVGNILRFNIPTSARKRFLYLQCTCGSATIYGVNSQLSRAEVSPAGTAGNVVVNVIA